MGEGTIRAYTPQDLGPVLDVWEAASRVAHPFLPESFVVAEREKVKDVYMPTAASWVWEEDEAVVGFISLIGDEVGALFVDPKNHRGGIGRALMEFVLHQHATLELEVFAENAGARSFYEQCGFVYIAERRHVDNGRQMLRMRHERRAASIPTAPSAPPRCRPRARS